MSNPTEDQPLHHYQRFLQQLPQDWGRMQVRQLGSVVGGSTPSRTVPSFWRGTIPWVTPGEVSGKTGKLLHGTNEHISASGLVGSGANLLPAGSLLVTTRATLGVCVVNAVPMATNQGFKSIVFRQAADSAFYVHLFDKVRPELVRRASGTTFLEISGSEFGSIEVPAPSQGEKLQISRILDTLDTAIHETEAIIAKLKAVKQGLLHDLLTRGIDANGELRPPQAEAPHLYNLSPLGWIPNEWAVLPLEQITEVPICYGIVQVFGFVSNGVPVLAIRDLHGDYTTGIHRTALSIDAAYPRSRVRPGDVLLSIKGTLGRVSVVPSHFVGNISRDIALIRPTPTVLPQYLAKMLQSSIGQRLLFSAQVGTTRGEISIAPLRRMEVPVPSVAEQKQLIKLLEASETQIRHEELALKKLRLQKSGLMDDLLTGRVRVTPLLNPTPA
ncbi:restriction endonuclease subunit S [Xenophilus arseniciresistens]|uniref:Restriction endonuclease subunit S n=1 Tax=Xenophilus arseniciresistens TaxID=1283306 RepID=A0AAE3N988_9BURK|nr:restriction endonuclease subunit S [Xenophilus arseniciresistens]MDA7418305.1 restriction endonuclease subunit S [Xenophilus arseniciresistens]